MHKAIAVFVALAMLCLTAGCGAPSDTKNTPAAAATATPAGAQIPNPLRESTPREIQDELGLSFDLPEGVQDTAYFIIDGDPPIAQAVFTLDGHAFTYRICSADQLEDISGAYSQWETVKAADVGYCTGEVRYNDGEQGVCLWYDAAPGILYSLYMDGGASEEALTSLAGALFVPFQKDAG